MRNFHFLLLGLTASSVAWAQPNFNRPSERPNANPLPPPLTLRAVLKIAQVQGEKDQPFVTNVGAENLRLTPQQRADLRAQLQLQGRVAK